MRKTTKLWNIYLFRRPGNIKTTIRNIKRQTKLGYERGLKIEKKKKSENES